MVMINNDDPRDQELLATAANAAINSDEGYAFAVLNKHNKILVVSDRVMQQFDVDEDQRYTMTSTEGHKVHLVAWPGELPEYTRDWDIVRINEYLRPGE